jgi:predicted GIY-YIG superfamily endonuclease
MDLRSRHRADIALRSTVPEKPGVYAWYRDGCAVYVGKGDDLRDRIWKRHMGQSRSMHTSAFRRDVAEHLGFGSARDIFDRVIRLNAGQLAAVRTFIVGCVVAWIECDSAAAAIQLEDDMKREWVPPLTKR